MNVTIHRKKRAYFLKKIDLDGQLAGNPLVRQVVEHSQRGDGIPLFFEAPHPSATASQIRIFLGTKQAMRRAVSYALPELAKLLGALAVDAKMDVAIQFLHIDTFEEEEVLVLSLT